MRGVRLLASAGGASRLLFVAATAVISALIEALAAGLLFVFLQLVLEPGTAVHIPLLGDPRSLLGTDSPLPLTAILAGFFVFQALSRIGQSYLQQKHSQRAAERLSIRLMENYLDLPYASHLDRKSADLIRNAHETAEKLGGQVFLPTIRLFAETTVLLGLFGVLLVTEPRVTSLVAVVLLPLVLVLAKLLMPRLKRLGRGAHVLAGRSIGLLQQSMQGIREVVLYDAGNHFVQRYGSLRRRLARANYLRGVANELPSTILQTAMLLFVFGLFAYSTIVQGSTEEALATLGLFAYAGLRVAPALQKVVTSANQLKFHAPAAEEIARDVIRAPVSRIKAPTLREATPTFRDRIELEAVSFVYSNSSRPALKDVTITIGRGATVGVCGPTGGGKSTLVDVLAGLLQPTTGVVRVDGKSIHEALDSWHAQLGVVSQRTFLLDDTLRRNIAFGVADEDVDDAALAEAVRIAQLDDLVGTLERRLDSQVGELGVRLSGGQRQRVALARALYRRPRVLILDEGTSALDNLTEARVIAALQQESPADTLIMVAHRLSTVRECDRILFVVNGEVQLEGDYEALLRCSADFRRMAEST